VNSTLDWSPLKWTNKLEQIWNLSISDSSLILDTIGEDTIKTILSWIVITRIVIAHVFTITYVTNFYPIVTWSRPNLLLPWLLLSFFKNVFLEVIVIVIGLLLWYGRPFSLVVFLEFIFVKLIPLVLASYNWYSNSCLFLQLRYTERMRTLKRSMRSDSNLLTNQIYLRIEDRYRTGSLTSLFSYSSYDTYDANLSLSDNAKKLFGLTEQDILEARVRIKERAAYRRLTELDDDYFFGNSRMNLNEHLFFGSRHNQVKRNDRSSSSTCPLEKFWGAILVAVLSSRLLHEILASNPKDLENSENENINNPLTVENLENIDNPAVVENLESIEEETVTGADATTEVLKNKEEVTDMVDTLIISSLSTVEDNALMRQNETTGIGPTTENVKSVERSSSPVKMQTLFNCNCAMDDFKEGQVGCCSIVDMRTSTPKKSPDDVNKDNDSVDHSKKTSVQRYTYAYNVTNVTNDFVLNTSFPLMEKLLMNDLEILKSFNTEEQNAGKKIVPEDTSARELRKIQDDQPNIFLNDYGRYRNVSTEAQDLSDIVKDMTVTLQAMTQLEAERDDKAIGEPRNVVMQTVMVSKATVDGAELIIVTTSSLVYTVCETMPKDIGVIHSQNSSSQSRAQDTEKSVTKSNLPERSFDEMNIPRFYKDSMKVFDGCYEKDFANNVELQCLLQQMEKKKWNLFTGQTDVETSPTVLAKQNNEINANFKTDPGKMFINHLLRSFREEIPESTTLRSIPKEDKVPFQKVKAIDEPEPEPPRKIINPSKPVHVKLTRDSYTQVDEMERKDSTNSLDEAKRRRKQFFKRKWLKEQSRSVSPVGSVKLHPMKNDSRGPKNDCECKMQRLEAKYCASSDSTFNKKEESRKVLVKSRIDSLATLPLSQVTKQPESDTAAFRKKPPVYPKKPKKDTQTIVPNATSRKPPVNKRPEVVEPKRSMNRQFTNSTKVAKSKGRTNAAIDEEEALEMRYLKAYNEITLFKDKKELEAKKRTPRDTVVRAGQFRHFYSRKTDLRKDSLTSSAKENLSVDAATDVDPALVMSSKGNKPPMNAPGRSGSVSNDKHPCSKLSKVNKATDRLLDNFDRLYGSQTNKDVKRSRIIPDLDTRKQYTKYSRTRKLAEEEILSTNSSKKLEGTQKGRELERTPAEEDMRNRVEPTGAAILEIATEAPPQRRENAVELSVRDDCRNETAVVHAASIETEDKKLLTLVERFMKGNGATTWSSSSVEQGEEIPATVTEITNTEDQAEGSPKAEEERMEGSNVITPTLSTSLQSSRLDKNIEYTQFSSISDEMIDQRAGTSQDHPRASRKPDLTDLARNTEVSYVTDGTPGVILTNQNSQGSKNRPMDIVDARTGRMLHNAMSYSSMDSFLDFPSEVRTVEEIIRDTRVESSSNEFVCRVSNEAIFDDEFPAISRQANQLDNVLATIQEVQDLCIITIHRNDLPVDPELEISLGGKMVGDEDIPRFIKEDIITNIKFPIVIKKSDLDSKCFSSLSDFPLQLVTNSVIGFVKLVGTNLHPLFKKMEGGEKKKVEEGKGTFKHAEVEESIKCPNSEKKISIEESGNNLTLEENKANLDVREIKGSTDIKKDERNVHDGVDVKIQEFLEGKDIKDQEESIRTEQIERSCPRKTEKIIKIEESSEISRNEEEEKFDVNIEYQTAEDHVIIEKTECSIELKNIKSISKYEKEADINYQDVEESIIVEETEENTRDEEPRSNNTVEQVEEIIQILDTRRKEASINADRFEETEENIEISDSVWEESNLTIEGTNEVSKLESNFDKLEIVEHNEVSLKIILVFLLNVLYFYIRYICQEIYSFAQISRATTTLKPFEVHTVSTSTSTLLEKAELLEKIEHETLLEEDEEFFESSVDFENVDVFRSIDQRLQIVQDLASDRSTSRDSEFHNEEMAENLRKETEELGLNSSGYVTVEVSLLNKTDEKGVERFDVRDRFNDNVRKEKEENKLENRPAEQTTKSPFSNQGGTGHNDVNSGKSFLKQKSFSTSELEERKAIDLHAADEDVECGSSMSLLQDRVSSEKSQLNILKATLKIGEDMAEIQRNIKKRELDLMIIERSEEKTSEKESIEESKQESIEESKQDSIENSKEVPIGESKEVWIEELKEVSTEKSEEVSIGESKEVSIEESKQESIVEENTSNKANSGDATISSENYEESSSVHFDTTLDEMDSFNSIYTRASETPIVISFSELDNDDMEEFSIASNASNEAA
ncbi:hypothetical protein WN55_09152, partial [Dufourea novaeangliae]